MSFILVDFQILSKAYDDGYMECLGAAVDLLARSGSQKSRHSAATIRTSLLHHLQQRQAPTNPVSLSGARFSSDGLGVLTSGISVTPQQCMPAPSMIQTNLSRLETSVASSLSKSHPNYEEFPLVSPILHPRQTVSASKSRFLPYVKPAPLRELNPNTSITGIQRYSSTAENKSTFSGINQDCLSFSSSNLDVGKQQLSKAVSPRSKVPKEEEEVWRPF